MDDERTPPPPTGTDAVAGAPPPPRGPRGTRGTVAVVAGLVGLGLAVTAAVLGPGLLHATSTAGEAPPTATSTETSTETSTGFVPQGQDPTRWVEDTTALLAALPGVADARLNGYSGASAEITLDTPLPAPEAAQRTVDEAREILAASRGGAEWSLRLSGTAASGATLLVVDGTGARGTRGTDQTTGDPLPDLLGDDPVAYAVRLVAVDGVRGVALEPGHASVEVAAPADLVPVAGAVRAEGRGLTAMGTSGYGVNLSLGPDGTTVPDDALLALVAGTSAQPGVDTVLYEARRPVLPGTRLLSAFGSGDLAPVARWLDAATYDAGPLGYQVHGTASDGAASVTSGYVGGVVPGLPADGTTCDTDLLTLDAAWFDAALGRRFLAVTARNDDDAPCVLAGSPGLRFVASDGGEQDVLVEPDAIAVGSPVTLAPGELAQSTLSWRGGPTADGPALVTSLLVAAVAGATESVVPFADVPGAEHGLDLLDGATATVTPWTTWVPPGEP
ncbi:DUF4232 domain-containing protein [Cellulosimicrobium sp. PMB13]|uniref:DUF4232 domain-containing protein n=1 Tax=Cellulosimicrobium sp. PMB13 TaxID=3120158 RepID=UPI003F4C836F